MDTVTNPGAAIGREIATGERAEDLRRELEAERANASRGFWRRLFGQRG